MIEFTTLELTLMALCVLLFLRGTHSSRKARAMCYLVEAMCKDEKVLKEVKQAHYEVTGERV
jgi:hypothetical protein